MESGVDWELTDEFSADGTSMNESGAAELYTASLNWVQCVTNVL